MSPPAPGRRPSTTTKVASPRNARRARKGPLRRLPASSSVVRTSAPMSGYGASEVARMLGLSVGQVRSYVRAGFLEPARGTRGALRFSFSDLVRLRAAKGLVAARIPSRRVKRVLARLRDQLPEGRSLRDVHIRAEGDRIVVG